MKNFILRTITGVLFVALLAGSIVLSPITQFAMFAIITAMAVWEFTTLMNNKLDLQINRFITTVAGAYLFVAFWTYCTNIMGAAVFIPYLISIIYLFVSELYIDRPNNLQNWAFTMMAQLYIALPFASFNALCFFPDTVEGTVYYHWYALSVFCFLWSSDTGAYLVGCTIGKHRLFPRISPKKSWEGCIGGGVVAIIVSQILATFIPFVDGLASDISSRLLWAGLAATVVVFGTWGDLVESLIKRKIGVKDSGNILPGHGGMLDRFDSSLLAIPAAVVYIYTIMMNL